MMVRILIVMLLGAGPVFAADASDCPHASKVYRVKFHGHAKGVIGFNEDCTQLGVIYNRFEYVLDVEKTNRGWKAVEGDAHWDFAKSSSKSVRLVTPEWSDRSSLRPVSSISGMKDLLED